MASFAPSSTPSGNLSGNTQTDGPALVVLTSLFFMWGFITCLSDILLVAASGTALFYPAAGYNAYYGLKRHIPSSTR